MHPAYTSDKPGNCPICGMNLVPTEETDTEDGQDHGEPKVPDRAIIHVSPKKTQDLGVKTEIITRGPFLKTIRTVGRVSYAEPRVFEVYAKFEGWVERLYIDKTGEWVPKGKPLFSAYSPKLVATQQEFLLALDLKKTQGAAAEALVKAARSRLAFFDIGSDQIDQIEATGETNKALLLTAPQSGFVIQKNLFEGKKVSLGESLYTIADLSEVWVLADIYESDLPFVSLGQQAKIILSYYPGTPFFGRVSFAYPYLEPQTRTNKIRIELKNPNFKLRPDMYTQVELKANMGSSLRVPKDAVLDSGIRKIAFVDLGDGRFEPREIQTGLENETSYEVLGGLRENERVVTNAAFLIDSESSLRAATSRMGSPEGHAGHEGH
jgi:RND family efflux transporter MFP subunit